MKKTISLFLAIVNLLALFCMPVQAADVDVSQYGSATYTTAYYVPSGSGDSSIAYEQSGDGTETGGYVLTYSKASSATSVPADTLITGAGGGLGNVLIANNTYGARTFHSRYTFVESSSPILLQFQHKNSSNAVTLKDTFTMTNTGVTFGDASVTVAAPYDINIFQNVYTGETVIYVNDTVLIDQRGTGETLIADGATYWHKLNFKTTQDDSAFRLVLKNIRHMVYTTDVTLSDVVGYVMNDSGTGDEEPVDPPVDPEPEEPEVIIPENLQGIASYAIEGYKYNQLNNYWSEVTISDETDASGVITSTATSEETIASGKRIATFVPWADKSTIGSSAAAYTMHFGFTVNEISDPVRLDYQYRNSSSYKTLLCLSDSKVAVGDSLDSETFVEVQAPYTLNLFMNINTGSGYIFVNDQCVFEGNMNPNNCTQWREVRIFNLSEATGLEFITTAANASVYNAEIGIKDVVKAYMGEDALPEEPVEPEEPEVVIPEELQPLSDYALEGYFYKQLNNNWANITLSDSTDENGIITTTASYSGELEAGKRIASFQPWAEQGVGSSAAGSYTMHFGFTVNEITSPVYLEYNYSKNGGAKKTLISLSDSKVAVGGSIDGETYIEVTEPYTIDIFMNIQTCEGYIYVNDELLYQGSMRNSGADVTWREVRVFSLEASTDISFVTTAANSSIYDNNVSIEEVVEAYTGDDLTEEDPVEPPVDPEQPGEDSGDDEAKVKDVSEYSSWVWGTYYYVPGSAGNGDYITWSDTDESTQAQGGTHIQTAVIKSGVDTVPSGTGAIHLGGSLGNVKLKNNDNYGAKTFHTRFTFVESSSPILLRFQYQTSSNGGSPKDVCTMSNTGVTLGDKTVTVTAPYDINIFQNVDSGVTVIYVNDQILLDQRETADNMWGSSSHHWQQLRFVTTQDDSAFKLVIQNAHHDIYNEKVLLSDVIEYVMLNDKSQAKETNYWWTIDGIKTEWKEIQGAMDGICSITGNNTDGYVLTPNSINESHYGYARYFLGSDDKDPLYTSTDDSVLLQSVEYNPTNLTTGQIFEVRGNNAYQTLWTAHPATETEPAYLSISGNKVVISADKFYKIDFIVNNKDYEYYILVDGKIVGCGTIWATRQPLWQTVFSSYTLEESMTLKNVKTTLYDNSVSINDVVKKLAANVYVYVDGFVYDNDLKTLTATATVVGSETTFDSANLIYAAYTKAGKLISTNVVETNSEAITNVAEYETNYPHGELDVADVAEGEELIIKAYLWDSVSGMTPITYAGQGTYTVPVTVVEEETTTE